MSELHIEWHEKQQGYVLIDGRETFYDEDRRLRVWDTAQGASKWAAANLGRQATVTKVKPAPPEPRAQEKLF